MTLFLLLEDDVGPGVANTYKSCVIRRGHNPATILIKQGCQILSCIQQ